MAYNSKSPWVIHYDASSCNGCDIEVLAALCPGFDVERFGIINTGNPKHADIFLVTGSVNEQNIKVVQEIYDQMLEPKAVVACGICACSGGVFHDCYNVLGGVDKAIPVDVYVPGCAVRPEAIIDGVVQTSASSMRRRRLWRNRRRERRTYGILLPEFIPLKLADVLALSRSHEKASTRAFVPAVNTDAGVHLVYSFMMDGGTLCNWVRA